MAGLVLDIYLIFLFRCIRRIFARRGSQAWPTQLATIEDTTTGDAYAKCDVIYSYEIDGDFFTGTNEKPFIRHSSAYEYQKLFQRKSTLMIRIKPGRPDISVVIDSDQSAFRSSMAT